MGNTNLEFLKIFFDQIESQVQFGDSKASLLVAGDAILLAVSSDLIKMVSGCQGNGLSMTCMVPSVSLGLAAAAAALLAISLLYALLAARPSRVHDKPQPILFLFSYVARIDAKVFADQYAAASPDDLIQAALHAVHGKAVYASRKFKFLKRAIDATLLSVGFMVAALVVALARGVLG
jgi:hypothetical protein